MYITIKKLRKLDRFILIGDIIGRVIVFSIGIALMIVFLKGAGILISIIPALGFLHLALEDTEE